MSLDAGNVSSTARTGDHNGYEWGETRKLLVQMKSTGDNARFSNHGAL